MMGVKIRKEILRDFPFFIDYTLGVSISISCLDHFRKKYQAQNSRVNCKNIWQKLSFFSHPLS